MKPTISIVVPIYNVEPFLCSCIDSILNQTYRYFELILVDDGSPDNCPAICDEYAEKDDRIIVIHQQNGGISSARNAGIKVANGNYIMFVDSDDFLHPETCSLMYDAILSKPNSWILCDIARVDEKGKITSDNSDDSLYNEFCKNSTYFGAFKLTLSGSVCNKIYNLNRIKDNNIFFDEKKSLGEDVLFDITYYKLCSGIFFVSKPLYYYRVVSGSLTNSYHPYHLETYIELFSLRLPFIEKSELSDFCDIYFYYFLSLLSNVFDKRNTMSFLQKMSYNNRLMNSNEFKQCVKYTSGKNDSKLLIRITKLHNYYILWLFQKCSNLRRRFFTKS